MRLWNSQISLKSSSLWAHTRERKEFLWHCGRQRQWRFRYTQQPKIINHSAYDVLYFVSTIYEIVRSSSQTHELTHFSYKVGFLLIRFGDFSLIFFFLSFLFFQCLEQEKHVLRRKLSEAESERDLRVQELESDYNDLKSKLISQVIKHTFHFVFVFVCGVRAASRIHSP